MRLEEAIKKLKTHGYRVIKEDTETIEDEYNDAGIQTDIDSKKLLADPTDMKNLSKWTKSMQKLIDMEDRMKDSSLANKISQAKKFNYGIDNDSLIDELDIYLETYEYALPFDDHTIDIVDLLNDNKKAILVKMSEIKGPIKREHWLDKLCYDIPSEARDYSSALRAIKKEIYKEL